MSKSFVGPNNTSPDWEKVSSGIIVLPVGAFEQHSTHLPVQTDILEAQYFGEVLARELDGALLPPISIASSWEHSGFRGSFSLKPETLTMMLRDIADHAEIQSFDRMLVVNTHGGNFWLGPAVREWNRQNRKLKIIWVDPWAYADPKLCADHARLDIHAGRGETSIMMHLFPDTVGDERHDCVVDQSVKPNFQQPDLNLCGIKSVSPKGALGEPTKATAELGKQIVESIDKNMPKGIRERLRWLQESHNYDGT